MARSKKVPNVNVVDSSKIALTVTPVVEEKATIKKTKTPKAVKAPKKVKFDKKSEIKSEVKQEEKCDCKCCSVEAIPDDDKNIQTYNELYDVVLKAEAQNINQRASMMKLLSEMQSYQTAFANFERNFKFDKKLIKKDLVESLLRRFKAQTELLNNRIVALDMFLHSDVCIVNDIEDLKDKN